MSRKATSAPSRSKATRCGAQSDAYRHADPRQLVVEDRTAVMAPGGAPDGDVDEPEPGSG